MGIHPIAQGIELGLVFEVGEKNIFLADNGDDLVEDFGLGTEGWGRRYHASGQNQSAGKKSSIHASAPGSCRRLSLLHSVLQQCNVSSRFQEDHDTGGYPS